jgi:hypothetical protein
LFTFDSRGEWACWALESEGDEEETLYEISTLIPDIIQEWHNPPFEKRMKFIGALVHRVVLHRASPNWVEMRIEWKGDVTGFDFVDVAHIRIARGGGRG